MGEECGMCERLKKMELVERAMEQLGDNGRLESIDVRNGHIVEIGIKLTMKRQSKK
jgi:hypothetical protein